KSEGYMNDSVSARLDELSTMLRHDLNRDLDFNREDISNFLAEEIASRYYYDRGQIIEQLKSDEDKAKAVEILVDKEKYREILSPKK
ncbi:MAG: peptidase S41, partial [Muribaculaceae bacterium]|nr:peptidase S41 [Muribaculaceae bacterium]